MQRVTLRLPEKHVKELDDKAESGEFPTRSEAIRAAVREFLTEEEASQGIDREWSKM